MRYFSSAAPFLELLASVALLPTAIAKPYPVHISGLEQPRNESQFEKRQCAGELCGADRQLCCQQGTYCGVDSSNNWAICVQGTNPNGQETPGGGSWQYYTSTWVETDFVTRTSVWSSWVAMPTATPADGCAGGKMECGTVCCDAGYWCASKEEGRCLLIGGSSSPGLTAVPTATGRPTNTVPFQTPIPTGTNGTAIGATGGGGGLSGGAIAGIVIGVIVGILLLLFLCLYCCAKTAFDAIAAIFGFGKKKRRHTHEETYIEEHHHHSGSAGGGRRWYGQPSRPGRVEKKKKKSGLGGALGVGAALGTLALALGMKRKHDKKYHDDKSTTISGSSAYYSDYTSSSSASSSDRHTRPTRHSSRR